MILQLHIRAVIGVGIVIKFILCVFARFRDLLTDQNLKELLDRRDDDIRFDVIISAKARHRVQLR